MEIIKKKINKIYRKTASLNLYISVCTIKKERITDAYFFSITNGVFKTSTKGDSSIAYASW